VNETQIILAQLATERRHFAAVAAACEAALSKGGLSAPESFMTACLDYLTFAFRRLSSGASTAHAGDVTSRLAALRSRPAGRADSLWREVLSEFQAGSQARFTAIDAEIPRHPSVTEWRTLSRIDADVIVEERSRYDKVKATLPPGIALSDSSP